MPDTSWKALERQVAAALGGRRHVRASRGESAPDVDLPDDSPFGAVETKLRRHLPKLLRDGLDQARRYATDGRPPLLVVREGGSPRILAVLVLEDLLKLLGRPGRVPDHQEVAP